MAATKREKTTMCPPSVRTEPDTALERTREDKAPSSNAGARAAQLNR
jgi:hypothetical protein